MINKGPDLLVHMLVGALGGAVALSAGIVQSPGLSLKVDEVGNMCCAVDALSIFVFVALAGDRRLKAMMRYFVFEEPLFVSGVLRILAKIWLRRLRGPTT